MKNVVVLMLILCVHFSVSADCDTPALDYKKHEGLIFGFKVTKIWGNDEIDSEIRAKDTVVTFADYRFLIAPKSTDIAPIELRINPLEISKKILNSIKLSQFHSGNEERVFIIPDIKIYDLSADNNPNLIFFNVSNGVMEYSGAIGIINNEWLILEEPICY